jgi:hypothetical protein
MIISKRNVAAATLAGGLAGGFAPTAALPCPSPAGAASVGAAEVSPERALRAPGLALTGTSGCRGDEACSCAGRARRTSLLVGTLAATHRAVLRSASLVERDRVQASRALPPSTLRTTSVARLAMWGLLFVASGLALGRRDSGAR